MLVHTGDARSVEIDLRLAMWLAGVAGAVNAAGFSSLGYFSGNMTGNLLHFTDRVTQGDAPLALWFASLIAAFVAGSFASALLIEIGRNRAIRGIYAFSILAEAGLLACLALAELTLPVTHQNAAILLAVGFILGIQNAATSRISDGRLRTTHVTGTLTDIGIDLAVILGGAKDLRAGRLAGARLKLHLLAVGCFFLGGALGVLGYRFIGAWVFLLVALILCLIALPSLRRAGRMPR
ncbi:DUF1275 domain-containing protein [Thioclava sp. BHET1]|nr:DUF1275 domain-containing protein [Thioclava sp. BHET1]